MTPRLCAFAILCALLPSLSTGFDQLKPAQALIFDNGHLSNTQEGESLTYSYRAAGSEISTIEDLASMSITASSDNGRRDVDVKFLTGENAMLLPPFKGYRGNPMIIAMLEHIAQSMSEESGGGALYFRNRIRDALASDAVEMEENEVEYKDQTLPTTVITFYPFLEDQYLNESPEMKTARFRIELGDDVPGGLFRLDVFAEADDQMFERKLTLQ